MEKDAVLVLVINCGSSSLKFALFPLGEKTPVMTGLAECLGHDDSRIRFIIDGDKETQALDGGAHAEALAALLAGLDARGWLSRVVAVGHRVVHGGERFKTSALIDDDALSDIEECNDLAPLHNPANVLGIRVARAKMPGTPQVAVFDTAFHQTMPPAAYMYALPMRYYDEMSVRRYGFHGTSHRYVAEEAVRMLHLDPDDHGLVVAHLGNGASATAILNGKSVDTTMGMTPLEGLVMGTRCGDVDAGALNYVARRANLDAKDLDAMLNKQSGLLGLSRMSNDCRVLEAAAQEGHEGAKLALDVFVHRLARHIGGLAMSLPRVDGLIFTGGIGENSVNIRRRTVEHLKPLGMRIDLAANDGMVRGRSGIIGEGSGPAIAVVTTNEEWMIARDTAELACAQRF